ncbi:hypothetical protein FDP41_000168 [Naegleria fowleri]|uniref:inosine/xanthosine triphosphatase n=1 Tax=Naegleria fowleri TaxID=5763 RepID=A0A6A5CIM6_NAEFO|nr:uncharacterized protein FDP41_000168 [Naegleria fowleri]KAF0985129.1 hypothetical protein FDP41_000168 [Naegleria fowleri]CAG4717387.1 unnamed protein product [Naegleria fowleri]
MSNLLELLSRRPVVVVVVASSNPVKVNCVKEAFSKVFPLNNKEQECSGMEYISLSVPSQVSDQPQTLSETLKGATNRAHNARQEYMKRENLSLEDLQQQLIYFVGIEGGIEDEGNDQVVSCACCVVIESISGYVSHAKTSSFYLPPEIVRLLRQGMELGHANDLVFNKTNSKHETGAVGLLTREIVTRSSYYEQALILALIPFMNREMYELDNKKANIV